MAQQGKNKRLILASASPRRREILEKMGYSFEVRPSNADESLPADIPPAEAAVLLAKRKALSIVCDEGFVVLGSDTAVVADGKILGKPKDTAEAFEMLRMLSGRVHSVFTGVCAASGGNADCLVNETRVEFYPLSDEMIKSYIATGEPMDKAGSYGIQGAGCVLVKKIDGDFFSVMGLPAAETARLLSKAGVKNSFNLIYQGDF